MARCMRILTLILATLLSGCAGTYAGGGISDVRGHLPDLHFRLTDDRGHAVTEVAYHGRTTLVYFGYSGCGTECPVTLARLAALTRRVSPAPQILFVTVTPDTDRPAVLHAWLARFDPAPVTGLTGDSAETLARDLRAAWPLPAGPMHGDLVYVFDRDGHARFLIAPQASDRAAARAIQGLSDG
jgi:protein SCO1/2